MALQPGSNETPIRSQEASCVVRFNLMESSVKALLVIPCVENGLFVAESESVLVDDSTTRTDVVFFSPNSFRANSADWSFGTVLTEGAQWNWVSVSRHWHFRLL